MPPGFEIEIVIMSWLGLAPRARAIAAALEPAGASRMRVVYSLESPDAPDETGPGEWIRVPNTHFFGRKFARSIEASEADVLLVIQSDAGCESWPELFERCRSAFEEQPDLGIWAPAIDFTPWAPRQVDLGPIAGSLTQVAQTDGVVLAVSRRVVDRLRTLDYSSNNIGWGIDSIAIAFSYAYGMLVVRDNSVTVGHPWTRSYGSREARAQWSVFLEQMTDRERNAHRLLSRFTGENQVIRGRLLRARWFLAHAARRGKAL
jgi:hypothetical protein